MIKPFDKYVTQAIEKADAALIKIFRCRSKLDRIKDWEIKGAFEAGKIAKIVSDALRQDGLNNGHQLCRKSPIQIGNTTNMTKHVFPRAGIYMIDSTTGDEEWESKSILIQAKAIRPFLPFRGIKNNDKYMRSIIPFLDGGVLKNAVPVASMISKTEIHGGTYCPVDNFVFRKYAPKVSLIYCSWDQLDRMVLMLRPSNKDLNGIAYRAYCDVVVESIRLRHDWDLDFDTIRWNRVDMANSMAVADSQLMIREDNLLPEDINNIEVEDMYLLEPRFLLKVA